MDMNGYVMYDFTSGGGGRHRRWLSHAGYVRACVGRGTRADRTRMPMKVRKSDIDPKRRIECKNKHQRKDSEWVRPSSSDRQTVQWSGLRGHQAKTDTEPNRRVIERGVRRGKLETVGDREGTKE